MKRALLIGIDKYDNDRFPQLQGCVNDVNALLPLLETNSDGSTNFHCRTLVSGGPKPPDRKAIISAIDDPLHRQGDVALIYFAGHGQGLDHDVSIVSSDGDFVEPGVPV